MPPDPGWEQLLLAGPGPAPGPPTSAAKSLPSSTTSFEKLMKVPRVVSTRLHSCLYDLPCWSVSNFMLAHLSLCSAASFLLSAL